MAEVANPKVSLKGAGRAASLRSSFKKKMFRGGAAPAKAAAEAPKAAAPSDAPTFCALPEMLQAHEPVAEGTHSVLMLSSRACLQLWCGPLPR